MNTRILACILALAAPLAAQTGVAVDSLRPLDDSIQMLLTRWNVPGAAIALVKDGRLIYARGFGKADSGIGQPVEPDSLFRIGSISKPVTSVAVLKLVEGGKLRLDDRISDLLPRYPPLSAAAAANPRFRRITVRQLLEHTSGIEGDENVTAEDAQAAGLTLPLTSDELIGFFLSQPLAAEPGAHYHYMNMNYVLLGKVIEEVSGLPYESFVQTHVLAPMGITRMRQGRGLPWQRAIGEVRYYDYPGAPEEGSFYPEIPGPVPAPYGGFPIEALQESSGWIASAMDLARFLSGLDRSRGPGFLKPATVRTMLARPAAWPPNSAAWYGLGWVVQTDGEDITDWAHGGSVSGTNTFLQRVGVLNLDFAAVFNSVPLDEDGFTVDLYNVLLPVLASISDWPERDLFPIYYGSRDPRVFGGGIVNAVSLQPGPLAPGEMIALHGSHLGPDRPLTGRLDPSGALPTVLGGTKVTVNGVAAPLLYCSDAQVQALVPFETPVDGDLEIVLEVQGNRAEVVHARAAAASPALLTASGEGYGQAAALNSDWSVNSADKPAARGSIVALYGVGGGRTIAPEANGSLVFAPFPLAQDVSVEIGGRPAEVLSAGQAPTLLAGVFQVNVRIQADAPSGYTPVMVKVGDARTQLGVTLAIR